MMTHNLPLIVWRKLESETRVREYLCFIGQDEEKTKAKSKAFNAEGAERQRKD
jgi:hypothetical protein